MSETDFIFAWLLAAKAGIEWQSWLILAAENANLIAKTSTYTCPTNAVSQKFDGFLVDFMVTVRCIKTTATENNQSISVYQIESVACNVPWNCKGQYPEPPAVTATVLTPPVLPSPRQTASAPAPAQPI